MPAVRPSSPGPDAYRGAVLAAAGAVAGFLVLRGVLSPWGLAGTALAEWVGLAGVPVAWALGRGLSPGVLLEAGPGSGRRAGPRMWAAALLVGCAGIPTAWLVTWLQGDWIPPDPTVVEGLRRQFLAAGAPGLLLLLGAAALTPAVCEELVFRGTLLNALLRRWPPRSAILLSGLAFGLLHWIPGGEFRVLPTAAVGVLLAWLAWRTGRVLPAMAAHGLHNTLVLVSAAWAAEAGRSPVWGIRGGQALPPPLWLLLGGVAILGLAHRLLQGPAESEEAGNSAPSLAPPTPGEP